MQVLIDRAPSTDLPLPNSGWSLYAFDDGADQSRSLTGSQSVENGIHLLRAVFEADEAVDVEAPPADDRRRDVPVVPGRRRHRVHPGRRHWR